MKNGKLRVVVATVIVLAIAFLIYQLVSTRNDLKNAPDINGSFSCDAEIIYDDMKINARITKIANAKFNMEIVYPETLKGLEFQLLNDQIKLSYRGLSFDLDGSNLPIKSVAGGLYEVMRNLTASQDLDITKSRGKYTIKGSSVVGSFSCVYEPDSNRIVSISIPDLKLTANLTNYVNI